MDARQAPSSSEASWSTPRLYSSCQTLSEAKISKLGHAGVFFKEMERE